MLDNLTFSSKMFSRTKLFRAGLIVAIALFGFGVILISSIAPAALKLERDLNDFKTNAPALIRSFDEGSEISDSLADLEDSVAVLQRRAWIIRVLRPSLGWVPVLGSALNTSAWMLDGLSVRVEIAKELGLAAEELKILRGELISSPSPIDEIQSADTRLLVKKISDRGRRSIKLLESQPTLDDYGTSTGLTWPFDAAVSKLHAADEQLVDYLKIVAEIEPLFVTGVGLLDAGLKLSDFADSGTDGLDQIQGGLAEVRSATAAIDKQIDELNLRLSPGFPKSSAGSMFDEMKESVRLVQSAIAAGGSMLEIAVNLLDLLKGSSGTVVSDPVVMSKFWKQFEADQEALAASAADLRTAVDGVISNLESVGLVDNLKSVDQVSEAISMVNNTVDYAEIGPDLTTKLIRPEGSARYLILGQTSDELRASGGFTSSAWFLTFDRGALSDIEYSPIINFENLNQLNLLPEIPEALQTYMDAEAFYLRDVGWNPDFSTVGAYATDIVIASDLEPVDGVISITQWGLADLATALGGIHVEGRSLTGPELVSYIRENTDTQGTGFLEVIFEDLLGLLSSDSLLSNGYQLFRALDAAIYRKDVMIYSASAETQSLLESAGWAGTFKSSGTDRIAIVDSNVGWSKADSSISRTLDYVVDLRDLEAPSSRLTLSYEHDGVSRIFDCSDDLPLSGDLAFENLSGACYWNLVRVYSIIGSQLVGNSNLPFRENSIPVVTRRRNESDDSVELSIDENGIHTRGLFSIGAGENQSLTLDYRLPKTVVSHDGSRVTYSLDLYAQAGARGREARVVVMLPDGYEVSTSNDTDWTLGPGNSVGLSFVLDQDVILTLEMSASS